MIPRQWPRFLVNQADQAGPATPAPIIISPTERIAVKRATLRRIAWLGSEIVIGSLAIQNTAEESQMQERIAIININVGIAVDPDMILGFG